MRFPRAHKKGERDTSLSEMYPLALHFMSVIRAFEMTFEMRRVGIQILLMKCESRAEIRSQRGPASI